jgi:hypothetical protein
MDWVSIVRTLTIGTTCSADKCLLMAIRTSGAELGFASSKRRAFEPAAVVPIQQAARRQPNSDLVTQGNDETARTSPTVDGYDADNLGALLGCLAHSCLQAVLQIRHEHKFRDPPVRSAVHGTGGLLRPMQDGERLSAACCYPQPKPTILLDTCLLRTSALCFARLT